MYYKKLNYLELLKEWISIMARKKIQHNQTKAESITVRLDPKIRYGLELLARKQRRNLSSVVEWALQKAINEPEDGLIETNLNTGIKYNLLYELWDVEESDRLLKMAMWKHELRTFEEERLSKLIRESEIFMHLANKAQAEYPSSDTVQNKLIESLREYYSTFKKIDAGELDKSHLPKPPKTKLQK